MKYFDEENQRLIYIEKEATSTFWDDHWNQLIEKTKYSKKLPKLNTALILTQKYLPKSSTVLEGGCGLAMTSWYLTQLGYKTIALDYADKTVDFLAGKVPEINPVKGDVRDTKLEDNSIDGYWSFGVIEHFWDGFDEIIEEANRIIKKDGYFFVTFPQFSLLRRLKSYFGLYKNFKEYNSQEGFYQFALLPLSVEENIVKHGFVLEQDLSIGGMKGLKDEISLIKPLMQKIYDSRNPFAIAIRKFIDISFSWFCGHTKVLVFKKIK